jgi:arylsulfatase A-like enzyme
MPNSAVVVVVDRLGAGFLGPYGNTWLDTPGFNALASQSFLFEHVLTDSPRLETVYRSYWQGLHAMCADVADAAHAGGTRESGAGESRESRSPIPLTSRLAARGIHTTLITDEQRLSGLPLAGGFATQTIIDPPEVAHPAADAEDTQMAALFASAIPQIQSAAAPSLIWIHSRGMDGPWDAPSELRRRWADEDDPIPPDITAPPEMRLTEDFDPDELLGYTHAYAGQVAVADMCVAALIDAVQESTVAADTMVIFTSPRGYPLGEHRRVGPCDDALYGELLHVPLLVRMPDGTSRTCRSQALVQPADIYATLVDWLLGETDAQLPAAESLLPLVRLERDSHRDRACSIGNAQRAIRTPAWFLREAKPDADTGAAPQIELFAKPDDRWEVNDVTQRCGEVAESLAKALDDFEQSATSGDWTRMAPLPEILVESPA